MPNRYPAIRSLLAKCAGVMVLADAERLQAGDHSQDFVTLKLLSLIGELRDEQAHGWRQRGPERRPLALVLTKADKCDGLRENPREFAEAHADGAVDRLPVAVPAARGVRLLGDRRDGVPRQLRPAATGAAADRAARHHRAVRLVDDRTGRELEQTGRGGPAVRTVS